MKKKIALTLLIVVILLGIGGVYAYFATNAFKTDKELFFSYMTSDWLSDLKDENLKEYIKKQENHFFHVIFVTISSEKTAINFSVFQTIPVL